MTTQSPPGRLFVFGLGYSATTLARAAMAAGWQVGGTTRDPAKAEALRGQGIDALCFDGQTASREVARALRDATHVLSSVAPPRNGDGALDPVLALHAGDIIAAPELAWLGYLSTIGVYGNHDGGWVDEAGPPDLTSVRARTRVTAEAGWQALGATRRLPSQIFRLAGIYGPGRSQLDALREGRARRIVKPGQVFNRIHVADIADAVMAGMEVARTLLLNVVDDEPAPPQDVVLYGARLLDVAPPREVPFEAADLSPMARQFYGANRRVSNAALKDALGYRLRYPTYREGLRAVMDAEAFAAA